MDQNRRNNGLELAAGTRLNAGSRMTRSFQRPLRTMQKLLSIYDSTCKRRTLPDELSAAPDGATALKPMISSG